MPQPLDGKSRPCLEERVVELLESVALEGMAIGQLLNMQGERLQAVIAGFRAHEVGFYELEATSKSTGKIINDLIMKEWLLQSRFQSINDLAALLPKEQWAPYPTKGCPPTSGPLTSSPPTPGPPASGLLTSGPPTSSPPATTPECSILPTLNPEICAACERRSRCKYHQGSTGST